MTNIFIKRFKIVLTLIGLWYSPENYKASYLIYRSFVILIEYSFLLFNIIYAWQVWGDLEETSEGLYLFFTMATVSLKKTTFLLFRNRLTRLLNFMECDIFATRTLVHEKILSRQAFKMWRLYTIILTCGVVNCIEWAVMPWLKNNDPRDYPFKIWMPTDPAKFSDYCIGYIYQMITVCFGVAIYFTIDLFTVSIIIFASAQLEIVADRIKQILPIPIITKPKEKNNLIRHNNEILNECIQQHQAVIRFVGLIENMFNVNIFFQMSGTVLIICLISFRITIAPPNSIEYLSMFNYMTSMLAQLYLYCWCGNELTDRSQVLRDALYTSLWYEQDLRFRKRMMITMQCMKRPIIFRAGYYIPLSRPTFVSILRCSYSYFAVLNQANKK